VDVKPLREGTEAHLRLSSLASARGRYVDLRIPPAGGDEIEDGGVIGVEDTQSIVDLDQFFSMFDDSARKGLTRVVRGSGRQFGGAEDFVDAGWRELNPTFVASTRLFNELNKDSGDLRRFLTGSSRLVGALADRRDDLTAVVDRLATTTGAIAREEQSLSSAVAQAPSFLRRANTTYVNLRATLDDLDPLVAASKPVAPRLNALLTQLQPFARDARTPVRQLATALRDPGAANDLTNLALDTPPLRDIMVRSAERNGRTRRGSLAESAEALRRSTPIWAFWRPYGPDIAAFTKAFGNVGIYDANGNASRSATLPSAFAVTDSGGLTIVPAPERQQYFDRIMVRQRNRCPGAAELPAADGSNPWRPAPAFNCDPTQVRPGP
jgi:phospholipid/cholesterol/gamma-HCH transport system substrate-binding protein